MIWSAALSGAATRVSRVAVGRRAPHLVLMVGALFALGVLCGERADAAEGTPEPGSGVLARVTAPVAASVTEPVAAVPGGQRVVEGVRRSVGEQVAPPARDAVRTVAGRSAWAAGQGVGAEAPEADAEGQRADAQGQGADARGLGADARGLGAVPPASPSRPESLSVPNIPGLPEPSGLSDVPDLSDALDVSGPPETASFIPIPALPGIPALPDAPALADVLVVPGIPVAPEASVVPGVPELPVVSELPGWTVPLPDAAVALPGGAEGSASDGGSEERGRVAGLVGLHGPELGVAVVGGRGTAVDGGQVRQRGGAGGEYALAQQAPAGRGDGALGSRSAADSGSSRHGDAPAVTVSQRALLWLVPGAAVGVEADGTRDRHGDVPVFPG
ncbi:hypothetical protein [Streptomyces chromofuscus]|uniref:Uncharacterized protein n=1 Tax=Streptomyces chromofuscus TaxID=42881 RepID=A0A7M2T480_STRCW|nr:hypothetical protein [Streptomyces chromofuscus]QOV42498.1 hypothetical protein IPT68_22020 [Streptomyces chromofuscus]GGT31107.1 hypothetical protein GCM10010254_59620 [Streptomyces chromofuscus]